MLTLNEEGHRPEDIRVIDDWKVLLTISALQLMSLAVAAWVIVKSVTV